MARKSNRGGARPGAGRPAEIPEPTQRVTVTLPETHVEHLRRIGEGNVSRGVRDLVERDMKRG